MEPPMRPPLLYMPAPLFSASSKPTAGGDHDSGGADTWGPFGSAENYGAEMALAMGILLAGFSLGLLFMLGIRLYLRRRRGGRGPPGGGADRKPQTGKGRGSEGGQPSEPPTLYEAGKTELAGAAAPECAICLTEFEEGDALRVLRACRHGFHLECIERWLASSMATSRKAASACCPVCRACCLAPPPPCRALEEGGVF